MRKDEAEAVIRHLCHKWAEATSFQPESGKMPSFRGFCSWLKDSGFGHYLDFRSRVDPEADAEQWFDEELKQTWRS
jgi:hypothetical protein